MWAVYFIPRWLRRHEELSESRSIERFDRAMRILSRKDPTPDRRYVVMPPRPAERRPARAVHRPSRRAPGRPAPARSRRATSVAVRRRRVLAGLLLVTVLVACRRAAHPGALVGRAGRRRRRARLPGPLPAAGAHPPPGAPHPGGRPPAVPVAADALRRDRAADDRAPRARRGARRGAAPLGGGGGRRARRPRGGGAPPGRGRGRVEPGAGPAADLRQQAGRAPPRAATGRSTRAGRVTPAAPQARRARAVDRRPGPAARRRRRAPRTSSTRSSPAAPSTTDRRSTVRRRCRPSRPPRAGAVTPSARPLGFGNLAVSTGTVRPPVKGL